MWNVNDLMGPMLVASLVLIGVCTTLYARAYTLKANLAAESDRLDWFAVILGAAGALIWTIFLWPVMTGSTSGAYVVRVNGVATGGGLVDVMNGFVPFFIGGVALMGFPRVAGYAIWKLGAGRKAGKPSVAQLVISIVGIIFGVVFLGTGVSVLATEQAILLPAIVCSIVGLVPFVLGIYGIVRYSQMRRG